MPDRIDRRSFLARGAATGLGIAVVGVSGGTLAACTSASGSTSTGGHPNGITTATPKKGGQLIFGTEAEEKGFSTTQGTFDTTGILYARTVFDPLAIIAADGTVQPYLAQSITPNADYTVWTITMRPNLVFHDGAPCDAAAVAENFALQLAAALTGPEFTTIADVSVPSPLVVSVTMKSPWVPFDYYLAGGIGGQIAFIAEPNWLKSGSQTNPVGTGPFVFQEWDPNDHFTATRNPHYWRPGYPYLDSITYKPIPDTEQLLASLQSRVVDIIHNSTAQVTASLRSDTSLGYIDDSVHVAGEPDMNCLLLNLSKPPFDNLKVRQAAAMAVSSADYSKVIDNGICPPSTGPFASGSPYYAPTGYPDPDPDRAKQLVNEVQQRDRATGRGDDRPCARPGHDEDRRVHPTTVRERRYAGHLGHHPASSGDRHCPLRYVPEHCLATVRGGQSRPQLHLLEPHQRGAGVRRQHGSQYRPTDGVGAAQRTAVTGCSRSDGGLPGGGEVDGIGHPLHLDRPHRLVDRCPAHGGELEQPDHPGRRAGIRDDHRRHLAHPDLVVLTTVPTWAHRARPVPRNAPGPSAGMARPPSPSVLGRSTMEGWPAVEHLPSAAEISALPTFTEDNPLTILVSACLLGVPCGVDASSYGAPFQHTDQLFRLPNVRTVGFCPEDFASGTPRSTPDIHGGQVWMFSTAPPECSATRVRIGRIR